MILASAKGLVLRASGNTHLYRELNGNGSRNGNGNGMEWKGMEVELKWK